MTDLVKPEPLKSTKLILSICCIVLTGLVICLAAFVIKMHSPSAPEVLLPMSPKPSGATFDDLLDAIEWVESKGDKHAIGDKIEIPQQKWTDQIQWEAEKLKAQRPYISRIYRNFKDGPIEAIFVNGQIKIYEFQAIGAYQITQKYVDDVNRILKKLNRTERYSYEDRWDKDKSRSMTEIYISFWHYEKTGNFMPISYTKYGKEWAFKSWEIAARIHNGGPKGYKKKSTEEYWQLIKARLEAVE